jgi:hypothetical protein
MTARRFEGLLMYQVDVQHLTRTLEGMRFPAERWQILAWAEHNGVGLQLRAALQALPERRYRSLPEIAHEANAVGTDTPNTVAARPHF